MPQLKALTVGCMCIVLKNKYLDKLFTMTNFIGRIISKFKKKGFTNSTDDDRYDSVQIKKGIEALRLEIKGLELYQEDDYENAIDCFNNAILNGMVYNSDLYKYKGNCLQLLGRHASAISDLTKSIEIDPNNYESFYFRANSFEKLKDFNAQIFDLRSAIKSLSNEKELKEEQNDTLRNLKIDLRKAEIDKEFDEKRKKIEEDFRNSITKLLETDSDTNTKNFANDLFKQNSDSVYKECLKLGVEFDKDGKYDIALEYYDYAIKLNIENSEGLAVRGYCLQSLGYYLDAIEDFTNAIALTPNDSNLYFGRGNCYFTLKNYAAAVEDGEKAIYYSNKNNPLYSAYNDEAKDRGFASATSLYDSHVMIWKISNQSDSEKHLAELYQKALKTYDTKTIQFFKEREQKKILEIDKLMKRRDYE